MYKSEIQYCTVYTDTYSKVHIHNTRTAHRPGTLSTVNQNTKKHKIKIETRRPTEIKRKIQLRDMADWSPERGLLSCAP